MQHWQIQQFDKAATFKDGPTPTPKKGEALLRIHACALNFADLLMAKGRYQATPTPPFTPGLELAGEVIALGPDTQGPKPGSRVACYAGHGAMATMGCFAAESLIPIPDLMPFDAASAFLVAYGTSHLALNHKARLQPGETVLVTGAAGGVGLTAVEIAKQMGARVIATARGTEKQALILEAGADLVIDSTDTDLKQRLKAEGGIDVAYDTVGSAGFNAALGAIRPEGRIICIGFAGGEVPQIPANHLLVKNATVIGFWWGAYPDFAPKPFHDSLNTLMDWYAAGRLKPHISHRFPLSEAPAALELLKSRQATGKIVLLCS